MNAGRIIFSGALIILLSLLYACTSPSGKYAVRKPSDGLVVAASMDVPGCYAVGDDYFGYGYDLIGDYAQDLDAEVSVLVGGSVSEYKSMLSERTADIVLSLEPGPGAIPVFSTSYSILTASKTARTIRNFSSDNLSGKRILVSSGFRKSPDYDTFVDSMLTNGAELSISPRSGLELYGSILCGDYDFLVCESSDALISHSVERKIVKVYDFAGIVTVYAHTNPEVRSLANSFGVWLAGYSTSNRHATLHYLYFDGGIVPEVIGKINNPRVKRGGISEYDDIMQEVCQREGLDWRLMSAICYNESRFTRDVVSNSGARGLMQIMPVVARHFDVSQDMVMDPATNIMLAGKLINEIESSLKLPASTSDRDRMSLILASYNAGVGHVQDARRLARKYGCSPNSWSDVSAFLRRKSQPEYSCDPVVRNGRFSGSTETISFVDNVMSRYGQYCANIPR